MEFVGKRAPGMEFVGKRGRIEGQSRGKRVPGMEFVGKRSPGMEFVGKRNVKNYSNHHNDSFINDDETLENMELLNSLENIPVTY